MLISIEVWWIRFFLKEPKLIMIPVQFRVFIMIRVTEMLLLQAYVSFVNVFLLCNVKVVGIYDRFLRTGFQ
jgi:hypothetical protein